MQFDFEDVLAGTFGRIILLFLFILSATWVGSVIGGLAWFAGTWDLSPGELLSVPALLWEGPTLLINLWIIPNTGLLAVAIVILLVSESYGFAAWGMIVGFESLFVMLGGGFDGSPRVSLVAWSAWLVLLVMVETGIWLVRQMRVNRWAYQMAALSAENAMRRAEREAMARAGDQADDGGGPP